MQKRFLSKISATALLASIVLLAPEIAWAADALTPSQSFISIAANFAMVLISILNFFAWFTLSILDHIMDPQYIFSINADGTDGNLLMMLREIWQFTRDLVNLGFAIGLIGFAIMMIITGDYTKIKEHLPKFVVAVVLVNFSWFIPRVIFDAAQVGTYTVYQIPSLLGADGCTIPPTAQDARARPCEVILSYKFFDQTRTIGLDGIDRPAAGAQTTGWKCPLRPIVCVQMVPLRDPNNPNNDIDRQVSTATKVLDGLVVNHARLQWLAQIQFRDAEFQLAPNIGFQDAFMRIGGILIKLVIVVILHVAIVFPLVAMAAAFFIRIPVLWISMAFMPLIALGYAFPKLREGEYADLFWKWQEHFLQAVLLPIRVAVPFVIGFIMLNAGAQIQAPPNFGNIPILPVIVGVRDMWQFLWMGIAMFIIWHYSFEALKGDKAGFMGHFTEKIQSIGSSLGNIATQWPLSWQFIPVPGRVNPQTGEREAGRSLSPLQALHRFDPRTIENDLRLQRFNPSSPGSAGQNNQAAVKEIQNNRTVIDTRVNVSLNAALQPGASDQDAHTQLDAAFTELRRNFHSLNGLREDEILLAMQGANVLTPDRYSRLQELVNRLNRRTNRTVVPRTPPAPPAPAPAPAPAPPTP